MRGRRSFAATLLLAAGVACAPSASWAQPRPTYSPSSTHIFPAGGRRGAVVPVRIGAECLPPGASFLLTGQGVAAADVLEKEIPRSGEPSVRRPPTETPITYPREWESQITIAPGAPLGALFWRLSCAQGGTASRPFVIGDLPEFVETEPNSTLERAERVTPPVTLNGQICGERDVDYYRVALQAGDVLACEVVARRLGSRLDPVVEFLDPSGKRLPADEIRRGSDPVLVLRAAADGDVLLRIANVTHHGDPACVYRVNLTKGPFVYAAFPSSGRAGTTAEVEFLELTGAGSPQMVRRSVTFPATSLIELPADDAPHQVEREPNDSPAAAMELAVPSTAHGRFLSRTDEDWYRFAAAKGDRLSLICEAPSGSQAYPALLLTGADGRPLASASSIETGGRCRIEWQAPGTGDFRVRLRDARFGAAGGNDFLYRLSIRVSEPDFALTFASDDVDVMQGSKATADVAIVRLGGFAGEIELSVEGLPEGVQAEPAKVPAGANAAKIMLSAADGALSQSAALRVVGRAKEGERSIERVALARHLGCDGEGVSIGPATLDRLHVTVQHKPLFRLFCGEAYQYAHRGTVFPYAMEVERLGGFDGEIHLQIGDRQNRDLDGIEMFEVAIPPGESETRMPIYLPETMHINVQSQSQLYTQGWARFVDERQRPQSVLVLSEKRNMLRTLPPMMKLKGIDRELAARPGGEVRCRLHLERTTNFTGPAELKLIDPPGASGIEAAPATIPAGESEAAMSFRLDRKSPSGLRLLRVRASGPLPGGGQVISEETLRLRIE